MRRVAIPLKKTAKGGTTMAELRLLFRAQLGKGFSNLREIKQWIVAEAIGAAWFVEDNAFGCTAEDSKRFSIASGGDDANEASGALIGWNAFQFANQTGIVGLIICVAFRLAGSVSGIASSVL